MKGKNFLLGQMMRNIELTLKQNGQKKKEMTEIQIQSIERNISRQSEERKKIRNSGKITINQKSLKITVKK